jgi:hypothetical protein
MSKIWDSFEIIPAGLFILYLTGFLIINTHLAQYGIYEVDLLNYARAGTGFFIFNLIPILAAYVTGYLVALEGKQQIPIIIIALSSSVIIASFYGFIVFTPIANPSIPTQDTETSFIFIFVIPGLMVVLLYAWKEWHRVAAFLLLGLVPVAIWLMWRWLYRENITLLYCLFITWLLYAVFGAFRETKTPLLEEGQKTSVSRKADISTAGTLAIFVLLVSSVLYGLLVYKWVPMGYGGGRSYNVRLYLSHEETEKLLNSQITTAAVLQKPVEVVYITGKMYYIRLGATTIALPVESITGFDHPSQ